jgi:hypothetical protein
MDTRKSPEVWGRLSDESARAHAAFLVYRDLPPPERSIAAAWRRWTDNAGAGRASPFFEEWARKHAWSDRARAFDFHIERIRQRGMEAAIEAEAMKRAQQAEQMRGRYNEILARTFEDVIAYLESGNFVQNMRPSDVISITKIYFEATRHFRDPLQQNEKMADLTPDELAELEKIVSQVEARDRGLDKNSEEGSMNGEEDSEPAQDEQG